MKKTFVKVKQTDRVIGVIEAPEFLEKVVKFL